jgi:hypothetical protein
MTTRNHRLAAIILIGVAVGGCALRSYREDGMAPATELLTIYQTQVAIGQCVFKPEQPEAAVLGAIAAALLTSAISQGVNYVGKAIAESAKETNDRVTAARNVEVTKDTFGPCLQIIRGWFYRGFANEAQSKETIEQAEKTWARASERMAIDEGKLTQLWQRRMWLAAQPDFLFEAEVVPSSENNPDQQALVFNPVYARLNAPISTSWLRSKAREVAVFVAFHEVGSDPAAPDNAAGGMALGKLEPNLDRQFPPAPSDMTNTPNRGADESKWFTLSVGESKKPMTITALVTEHQEAQPFLQFVADVFNGATAPISTELQQAIVPTLRQKAEESEQAAAESARGNYEDSLAKALASATTCAAGVTDPVGTSSDIRGQVRTLNKSARAAGKSEVKESLVPLSTSAEAVRTGCIQLRDTLRDRLAG